MKKFLIGMLFLVAMVLLTSPAFGAMWTVPSEYGGGTFHFDSEVDRDFRLNSPPSGDDLILGQINDKWGLSLTKEEYGKFDGLGGTSGSVVFPNPVNIVVAKWGGQGGGSEWAFQLTGFTENFEWKNMSNAMSHVGYNPVPIPAAAWLLGSGLLGLLVLRRRRSS